MMMMKKNIFCVRYKLAIKKNKNRMTDRKNMENSFSLSLSPLSFSFLSLLIIFKMMMHLSSEPPLCHYPQIYSSQQFIPHSLSTAPTLGGSQQFYSGDRGIFDQPREYYPQPGHFTPLHPGSINGSQCHISPL